MKLGYTIIYVDNVGATIDFYRRAFGLSIKMVHETGTYAELDTGATTLAFTANESTQSIIPTPYRPADLNEVALGFQITLVTDDVPAAYAHALAEGGLGLAETTFTDWGQSVAYLRDPAGIIVELATPLP